MTVKRYCITRNCDGEVGARSKSDMCPTCQQGLRYWDDREPSEVMERRRKLTMLHDRLGHMHTKPKKKAAPARARRHSESRHEARV